MQKTDTLTASSSSEVDLGNAVLPGHDTATYSERDTLSLELESEFIKPVAYNACRPNCSQGKSDTMEQDKLKIDPLEGYVTDLSKHTLELA